MNPQTTISLLVTGGDGPAECRIAVGHVLARMQAEADQAGFDLDVNTRDAKHGPKSALVLVHGIHAADFAQRWCGTIQWVAKSRLRPHQKRQNWFIGVYLQSRPSARARLDLGDVSFESFRAGGPGGQHQNTTDSAVRVRHRPSGISVVARSRRSQHRNKSLALARLQLALEAQTNTERAARKGDQNKQHHHLERGNPIRRFKGVNFQEMVTDNG